MASSSVTHLGQRGEEKRKALTSASDGPSPMKGKDRGSTLWKTDRKKESREKKPHAVHLDYVGHPSNIVFIEGGGVGGLTKKTRKREKVSLKASTGPKALNDL